MKTLSKIALTGATLLALAGCKETKTESSDLLYEDAIVSDVVYSPSKHGSGVGPTIDLTGEGGMGIAFTSVSVPEKYAVVFKCQHGKFIVEGETPEYKELWNRFEEGDSVNVSYKEIYKSVYENDRLIERTLTAYDFLDAQKK